MKKAIKKHLLLEQLEERVFLDANPIAAADPIDIPDHIEPVEIQTIHSISPQDVPVPQPDTEQLTHPETETTPGDGDTADTTGQDDVPETTLQASPTGDTASTTDDIESPHETTAENPDQVSPDADENEPVTAANPADSQESADTAELPETNRSSESIDAENTTSGETTTASLPDTVPDDVSVTDDASEMVAPHPEAIDPMIGEDFNFSVNFNNTTGTDVYGPYIDLLLDGGYEGAATDAPLNPDGSSTDGITFVSADYLGSNVTSTVITITQNEVDNGITHPWATDNTGAALIVHDINGRTFHVGDQFVSLRMPFGSFTSAQPAADVTITAHMGTNADVDVDLGVHTTTGAMYGHDALNNPTVDSPLRGSTDGLNQGSISYKPEIINYRKDITVSSVDADCQTQHAGTDDIRYFADDGSQIFEQNHQEIPTGQNYPATYVATIDVADGQTVTGLSLTEHLPDNIYYLGDNTLSVSAGGTFLTQGTDYTVTSPGVGVHGNGDILIQLTNSIQGGSGNQDVVIRYDFYVPEQDASGAAIINPATGNDTHITNNGEVGYSWDPATNNQGDLNDTPITNAVINPEVNTDGHFSSNPDVDDISHAQSISIQKDHTIGTDTGIIGGYNPGDTLVYTLDFQISDYFSFGDHDTSDTDYSFRIDDVVADGLAMNGGTNYSAGIDIWQNGTLHHIDLVGTTNAGDKMWVTGDADHNLLVHYNLQTIAEEMGIAGGILQGDMVDGNQQGATHGQITYRADIMSSYHSEPGTGGDLKVDQGDVIDGGATITGDVYNNNNSNFTGQNEADKSCDSIHIVKGEVSKDIYAINGTTGVGSNPHISPGDTVTYHLHYDMPISSTEDFHLTDYLPLPIFDVNNPAQNGTSGWNQDSVGTLPSSGHWSFTNNDTYHTLGSLDSVSAQGGNTLVFDWAPYHDTQNNSSTAVDILFTVTASNEPFADGMFLTNQVRATEQGTPLADNSTDAIVQIVLDEPDLTIDKIANPISGIDAGDTVTFTVTVENAGHSSSFDTIIKDTLPDGFDQSAVTFSATQGGTPLVAGIDFNWTGGGIDGDINTTGDNFFADPGADGIYGTADDGNDGGIELIDGTDGQLHDGESVVITYTLTASSAIGPNQTLTNTATITNFAGAEGATDHTTQDISDNAIVHATNVAVDKAIIATSQPDSVTSGTNVTIGETVTYSVTMTLPEGSATNVHFSDTLDASSGLEIASLDSITTPNNSSSLLFDNGHNNGQVNTFDLTDTTYNVTYGADNLSFDLDLGTVTNNDRDNGTAETITLTYTVLVRNVDSNDQGDTLTNRAQWNWTDGNNVNHEVHDNETVTVVEPEITTIKHVEGVDLYTNAQAGDQLEYTLRIENTGTSTSFETEILDTLAQDTTYGGLTSVDYYDSAGTNTDISGDTKWNYYTGDPKTVLFESTDGDSWDIAVGDYILLTYKINVTDDAIIGNNHTNTADADWTNLDGTAQGERIYNDDPNHHYDVDQDKDTDTATFSMPVSFDKTDNGATAQTIGDTVSYTLTITPAKGTFDDLVATDALPAGIHYENDGTADQGTPTISFDATTNTIKWDFGDYVSDGTDIHITYTATVTNADSNYQGQTLTNHAALTYNSSNPDGTTTPVTITDTDNFDIQEPIITTIKDVSDPADPNKGVLPGEVLTYTVQIENTGSSTAYEVTALDTLPTGVQLDLGTNPTATYHNSGNDATIHITDNHDDTLSFDSSTPGNWDIAVGDYITVTYGIKVVGAGYVVGPHTNTIDADWTNRDGDPGGYERIYDDGATQPQHAVDQTQDEDPATFTVLSNPPSVGDYVWFDQNSDGIQDANEPGISNVHVNLYQDANDDGIYELLATATTDANGGYLFANVPSTTNTPPYKIMVDSATLPNGMIQTWENTSYNQTITPHDADLNGTSYVEVLDNDAIRDVDFGYQGINSVGDTVWYDVNGDGHQDTGEDGINGLSVTLHADIDGDGIAEYTETQTTRTINGVDGQYLFEHLPYSDMQNQPDFTVSITPPAGSTPTYDQDGGLDNTTTFDLDPNDTHLTDDNNRDDIDFGVRGTGSIGDFVWYDTNGDGNQDEGSATGLGGVTVTLTGDIDGDHTIDYRVTTTTADDGSYHFNNLLGGDYTITVDDATLPGGSANWHQTYDEDGTGTANTVSHTLVAGNNDDRVDFGYTGSGSLGDTVWYDTNGNGAQEANELGLAGVTVTIFADVDGDGINESSLSTTTDANGMYHFDHLVGAEYTISVDTTTLPNGATPTYDLDSATNSPDSTTVYTLATGEHTDRVDFGYTGTGSIGDTVWNDTNGDGVQGAGENGFTGVTITLTGDLDHDGLADDTITTTTDANGHYSFDNLFLGDYTIAVDPATLPPGNSQTHDFDDPHSTTPTTPNTANVTIDAANPVNNDVDFGYNSKGTIGDTIWYDADNNGIQDPGELGLAGVTVTLTGDVDGDGNPDTVTETTDANGHYLFDQLSAGNYTITVGNLPAGMSQTADPDGVHDSTTTLTLAGGETNLDQDFGYTGTGSIGDTIWNDTDGDGTQNNGETGLAGITVTLTADLNNDGVLDTVTTTTDANGNYHFDNLPADNYTITIDPATLPPGMQETADPDGGNDNTADVTLAAGETNNDQDFGYQQTGTIGDTIWYDADGDGIQDPGELGLNGVTVTLTDSTGATVATVTTGSDGTYLFDGLTAGDYTVTLTGLPNGMTQTADPDGGNDNRSQITIGGAQPLVNLDQDFGYTGTGSIGDTIWNDVDGDGIQNNGETGLGGVTVTLTGDFNGDGNPDTVTVTTDSNGQYHFDRLPEGQYTITVDPTTLPPGMQQTADPDGGNDNTANVTLMAGETNNDQDFGYRQSGTIGDTIWFDADGDGIQDPGELGLANVQVTLVGDLDGDGQADDTLTTITDANGNYLFDRLPAGTYAITVDPSTLPAGMTETFDLDGTGSANTAQVTIGDHEANLDVDFGYKGTGSIGDTIWFDADNDGIQDPGEAGIPGVTVTITGDFDNDGQIDDTMTVTTGPDGTYVFPNLPAGEYDITVDPTTLPGGMNPTGDPDGTPDNTTHLTLNAGEINLDQDFGYTGTGSIGDQLWNDRNGNGVMDPGENPLPGVEVCIGVDLDGDGQPDYRATTVTGSDGTYIFDNLPAGAHTVCVNPATLPPGIRPSFDPDGTDDNSTVINLGPGEHNLSADFGYLYPPEPVPPVSPVMPPVSPVIPPEVVEPGFADDPLLAYQQFGNRENEEIFLYPFDEIPWPPSIVPVSPVYSGHAEPGTTLQFTLYDPMGNQIGQQSIMADTAGNWLVSFPGTLMFDLPHHMAIEQTISTYNASSAGFFNMRTYFNPSFNSMVYSSTQLDVATIFAYLPSTIMESIHASTLSSLNIQWNNFNGYEFFAPSTQPAGHGH